MSDCIIQISRDNSFYGSGLTVGVALDGCDVGTLKNGEELRAVAAPGQHELSFYRYRRLDKTISFTIAEGQQNAFFTIKINASNRVDVVGGLKTKKQAKRPSGCLTALIVFLCLFVFIGAAFASCGSSSKPEKVGTSVSSSQQPPQQSDSGPETFGGVAKSFSSIKNKFFLLPPLNRGGCFLSRLPIRQAGRLRPPSMLSSDRRYPGCAGRNPSPVCRGSSLWPFYRG